MTLGIENQLRQEPCCQGAFRAEEPRDKLICYHRKYSNFYSRANPEGCESTTEEYLSQEGEERPSGGRYPWIEFVHKKSISGRGKGIAKDPETALAQAIHEIKNRFILLEQKVYWFQVSSTYCVQHPLVGVEGYSAHKKNDPILLEFKEYREWHRWIRKSGRDQIMKDLMY